MNLTPWAGSNFRAAVSRPRFPSPIRSRSGRPRFWDFLATEMTNRRFRVTSSSIAACSPLRTRCATAISSAALSSGARPTSWRYRSRMSRSASKTPRPAALSRLRFLALVIAGELPAIGDALARSEAWGWYGFRLTLPEPTASFAHGGRAPGGRAEYSGGVAQLGERVNGIHEVRGSIPLASIRAGGAAAGASDSSCAGRARDVVSRLVRSRE